MKRYLNIKQVSIKICFCRSKIYRMIKDGEFPHQIKIGTSSRWDEQEVENWMKLHSPQKTAA